MAKHRMQPGWGLAAGTLFGLIAGTGVCGAIGGDHSEQAALEIIGWFFLGGTMTGLALGLKFNPTVSVYWPWLVVIFGLGCIVANNIVIEHRYQVHAVQRDVTPFEYAPHLISALIATAIAVIAGIVHHVQNLERGEKDDASNFSLTTILLVLGGASLAFGLLRWIAAPAVFFYIVVLFILGRFACLLVNAELSRRKTSTSPPAATPKNGHTGNTSPENGPD